MGKILAIDCGKYNTKVCAYDRNSKKTEMFKFRTKMDAGTFEDDMIEKGTVIAQIDDGPVYRIGMKSKGEPELETSKKTEIHRVCTIVAVALASANDKTDIAIGMPLQIADLPEERKDYKDYILGEDGHEYTVKLKTEGDGPVREVKFHFDKKFVYPEGIGVLFEYPSKLNGPTAIIDIGNLNTNNMYTDRFNIITEACFTDEMGGKVMISNLAQTLSSELGSRVDDNLVASTLLKPFETRFLVSRTGNNEIEIKSKRIIDSFLSDHVKTIKRKLDTRHYPLDFMDIVCIGGTSKLLGKEIKEVFGENAFIPDEPEYVNAKGFLKKIGATLGVDVSAGQKK